MPGGFEAVFFDFDGVLLDSEPVHFECWNEALAPLGVSLDWENHKHLVVGASERATVEVFHRCSGTPRPFEELWAVYELKRELFSRRMERNPPFIPGLRAFFESLANTLPLAVVSSSARCEVEPLLEAAGIRRFLAALVCGDDVERHKPEPDPYLLAARLLGIRSALVVEDSEAGMESARRAGFEALRIPSPSMTIPLVRKRLA